MHTTGMSMDIKPTMSYTRISGLGGPVARTIDLGGGVLVDIDHNGYVMGVEAIGVDQRTAMGRVFPNLVFHES